MLNHHGASTSHKTEDDREDGKIREIHALTPPHPHPLPPATTANRGRHREA